MQDKMKVVLLALAILFGGFTVSTTVGCKAGFDTSVTTVQKRGGWQVETTIVKSPKGEVKSKQEKWTELPESAETGSSTGG